MKTGDAVFPILFYRQLRCDRITVHKNLFISYVMTGLLNTGYLSVVAFDDSILIENPVSPLSSSNIKFSLQDYKEIVHFTLFNK